MTLVRLEQTRKRCDVVGEPQNVQMDEVMSGRMGQQNTGDCVSFFNFLNHNRRQVSPDFNTNAYQDSLSSKAKPNE